MTFRPTFLVADKGRELRWIGHLLRSRSTDREHRLAIEPIEKDHVRFIQEERFTGTLVPLLTNRRVKKRTEKPFVEMNEALKQRVEVLTVPCVSDFVRTINTARLALDPNHSQSRPGTVT
jgi:hypothetical protein